MFKNAFIFATLGLLLAAEQGTFAQGDPQASIAFACAVSTPGKCFFEVDGEDLNPSGFVSGRTTGWIRLPAGKHTLRAEQHPGGNVELSLDLAAGESKILLLHTEFVTSEKPGRPPKPELRLVAIPDVEPKQKTPPRVLKVYNALPEAVTLTTDQTELTEVVAQPKKLETVGFKGNIGFVTLMEKAEPPATEPLISVNFQEPSTFFILLYEAEEGKRKAISLQAP
jgi:hypothetical protein